VDPAENAPAARWPLCVPPVSNRDEYHARSSFLRGERGDSNPRPPGPQPRSERHAGRARRCSLLPDALRFSEIRSVTCPVACHEARSLDQPTSVVGTTVVGPTVIGSATIRREATHARRTYRAAGVAGNTQPRYSVDASANLDPCARSTRPGGAELGSLLNIYVSCDRHLSRLRQTLRWRSSRWRYSYVRRRSRNAQPPPSCAQGPARSPCGPDLFKRAVWSGTRFLRLLEAAAAQPGLAERELSYSRGFFAPLVWCWPARNAATRPSPPSASHRTPAPDP
jgi:hypothetical protein